MIEALCNYDDIVATMRVDVIVSALKEKDKTIEESVTEACRKGTVDVYSHLSSNYTVPFTLSEIPEITLEYLRNCAIDLTFCHIFVNNKNMPIAIKERCEARKSELKEIMNKERELPGLQANKLNFFYSSIKDSEGEEYFTSDDILRF